MLTSLKDSDGKIIAYCEWRLVDKQGRESQYGIYVWVNDMWVHETFRKTGRVNRIIDEVMRIVPQAEYCYFQRKNVSNKLHLYTRRQMERKRMAYDKLIKDGE